MYQPEELPDEEREYPEPVAGMDTLLRFLLQSSGSDLHLAVGEAPRIRVRGALRKLQSRPVDADSMERLIRGIVSPSGWDEYLRTNELDTSYAFGDASRFRVNLFKQQGMMGAVLRAIPFEIKNLEALGLPPVLGTFADLPRGLVLVTGPTGSGKSTTLASIIDLVNRRHQHHIMTLEDPIEFVHQSKLSLVNQREIGRDTESFSRALKAVLRQDPDVILIGEMRDPETISTAMTAAETGHLVFATLHTSSAKDTVSRIVDSFPAAQQDGVRAQIAASLYAVVCQTLCKSKDGKGRVPAMEIMVVDDGIRANIREGKLEQIDSLIQTTREAGSRMLDSHLIELVASGAITPEEAVAKARNRTETEREIRRSGHASRTIPGQEL